jgi:two-component system OmpR family response regulator
MAHILVVEDEPHIRFLICKVLEVAGHTTEQAGDGLEALHMLYAQTRPYGLIVMDVQMPKMDGYRLLDMLRRQPSSIPVIMLTAHRNLAERAVDRGADGGLTKPINRKQLVDLVNRLVTPEPAVILERPAPNLLPAYK